MAHADIVWIEFFFFLYPNEYTKTANDDATYTQNDTYLCFRNKILNLE